MLHEMTEVSDKVIEYAASRMEAVAAEMRHSRPDRIEIHDSRHVREVPSDRPYIVREDAGLSVFGVVVEFPPGVMIEPRFTAGRPVEGEPI